MRILDVHIDAQDGKARALSFALKQNIIETPIFMPVGTQGCIKSLDSNDVWEHLGAKIILANTYHMYLRMGIERMKMLGGLHQFAHYKGSYLTDSGGFQAFSLQQNTTLSPDGVAFKSHIDGSKHFFTPELVLDIQYALNSDIMMVLDDLVGLPADEGRIADSIHRTTEWAKRSLLYHQQQKMQGKALDNHLFAIIQGGTNPHFRERSAQELVALEGFDGYAIGGLAVGESNQEMYETIAHTTAFMPTHKPRYLMGVGTPENIIESIALGVDMFDCVMPSRNARNATLFTSFGKLNIKGARFMNDDAPIDEECDCYTCRHYSRAYLCHLFRSHEVTYHRLATIHNLRYYLNLVRGAREAILKGEFNQYRQMFYHKRQMEVSL